MFYENEASEWVFALETKATFALGSACGRCSLGFRTPYGLQGSGDFENGISPTHIRWVNPGDSETIPLGFDPNPFRLIN